MEAVAAVRIRSAAAASTSYSSSQCSWTDLNGQVCGAKRTSSFPCSRKGGSSWSKINKCCDTNSLRASAVARESRIVKETCGVNGTKVEGGRLSGGKLEELHDDSYVANPLTFGENNVAFGKWIGAMAAAILTFEKQKRVDEDTAQSNNAVLDTLRRGKLVESDLVYRQTFVIRSYEAGFDKIASIETITNLFQETALNHVGMSKFVGDGMGTTHAMMRHRLIWVVTRMHVEVERYPVWGDVVEIDSWVAAEGKNGMRRDFLVRDYTTGEVITRATSTWVMMNQDTRRLSKMPEEVFAEVSPYYLNRTCIKNDPCQKIKRLSDAPYIRSDLVPRLRDMDMNQHVNNVKYVSWVLESVPQSLMVGHELTSMTLEYRRECLPSDVVQSLSKQDTPLSLNMRYDKSVLQNGGLDGSPDAVSCSSGALKSATLTPPTLSPVQYTHLLRMQSTGADIVYGRTKWRPKQRYNTPH